MKCAACGYENNAGEWNPEAFERYGPEPEKEDFIEVVGTFHRQQEPDYYSDGTRTVTLYACPKCNIVQMKEV